LPSSLEEFNAYAHGFEFVALRLALVVLTLRGLWYLILPR